MLKNKLIAIFMLSVFTAYVFVYPIALNWMRQEIRSEMKRKIKQNLAAGDVAVFTYDKKQYQNIQWYEKGKEFLIKEVMYDIISVKENEDGTYVVKAMLDSKEKQMLQNMQRQNEQNSTSKKCFSILFQIISHYDSDAELFQIKHKEVATSFHHLYTNNYSTIILEKVAPPPRSV